MFSDYFIKAEKNILKKAKPASKPSTKSTGAKSKGGKKTKKEDTPVKPVHKELMESLNNIIPAMLKIDTISYADPSGYIPEGVDFIAYKEQFRDITKIMGGVIPCDLVYGTFHVAENLNKDGLSDALTRVLAAKKINQYVEGESEIPVIPAFVIGYDTEFKFSEFKKILVDHYMSKNIDHLYEVDIIAILGQGLVVKDWREKRSYIALETGKDTLMWLFILMNEYLDIERGQDFDLRYYVKHAEKYNEY